MLTLFYKNSLRDTTLHNKVAWRLSQTSTIAHFGDHTWQDMLLFGVTDITVAALHAQSRKPVNWHGRVDRRDLGSPVLLLIQISLVIVYANKTVEKGYSVN